MINRTSIAGIVFLLISSLFCSSGSIRHQLSGQEIETASLQAAEQQLRARFIEYETRLNAILKTRRIEEREFIAAIMQLVELGQIPVPMIESSFLWVRKNRPDSRFPFVYFEQILRLQAAQEGYFIPDFDYAIYSQTRSDRFSREERLRRAGLIQYLRSN